MNLFKRDWATRVLKQVPLRFTFGVKVLGCNLVKGVLSPKCVKEDILKKKLRIA